MELINLIRTLPEQDAVELFRCVRSGSDLAATLSRFRDGDLLLQMHLAPETRLKYDLPYSVNLPAVLLNSGSPYLTSAIYELTSQHSSRGQTNRTIATEIDHTLAAPILPALSVQYTRPYHAATLFEPRLDSARPSEWTTVCKDDVLMREILAAYFTHEYHLFPIFYKDYFLEDMQAPCRDEHEAGLCSALLVNAVLAYGCVG